MIFLAQDGPDYAPNKTRMVEVLRAADSPQNFLCRDIQTEEILTVHANKLRLHWHASRNAYLESLPAIPKAAAVTVSEATCGAGPS